MGRDTVVEDERVRREQLLDRQEASLSASERALDARWAAQRKRVAVLRELADYVRDREETLRSRASHLGLTVAEVESLLPEPEAEVLDDQSELMNRERLRIIEAREALVNERSAFHEHWKQFLDDAEAGHSLQEDALIAQEQAVAEGFRRLVMLGREGARVEDIDDDRAWERAIEGAFEDDKAIAEGPKSRNESQKEAIPPPWPPSAAPAPPVSSVVVPDPDNRRRFERIMLDVNVDFGSPHNFYTGTADNISVGGLFVATRNLLPEGRTVTMRFSLPGTLRMDIEGIVAWRRLVADATGPVGLGLRFARVPDEARDEIERFIRQRLPMRA